MDGGVTESILRLTSFPERAKAEFPMPVTFGNETWVRLAQSAKHPCRTVVQLLGKVAFEKVAFWNALSMFVIPK